MKPHPLRLAPGTDLRAGLEAALAAHDVTAAFVLQGIGSLARTRLRLAGRAEAEDWHGDFEILTLAGSLSPDGGHLHMSVADANGRVFGGHVAAGCIVRTTAEVLLLLLPGHRFARRLDAQTGFPELLIEGAHGNKTPPADAPAADHLR